MSKTILGYGEESTSYIESVWANLKRMLSRFYIAVQSKNFIFFAKQCEWRKKVSSLNNQNKLKNLQSIFLHVSETVHFVLTDKSSIEDYEKEEYEDGLVDSSFNEEDSNSNSNDSENMNIEL